MVQWLQVQRFMLCVLHTHMPQRHTASRASDASLAVQVLQLQSATTSPRSEPVDYEAGIEAMLLAILQQTNTSQQAGLAELAPLALLTSQNDAVQDSLLLAAFSDYLNGAMAANANLTATVETSLLNISSTSSVLPVSRIVVMNSLVFVMMLHCTTSLLALQLLAIADAPQGVSSYTVCIALYNGTLPAMQTAVWSMHTSCIAKLDAPARPQVARLFQQDLKLRCSEGTHTLLVAAFLKRVAPAAFCECMQGKISASTLAVRAALIRQRIASRATLSSLTVPAGCNRTADMQYSFVVRACLTDRLLQTGT